MCTVRDEFVHSRGSTLLALSVQSLSFDDNGITGLFCSHSEVVFRRFQNKKLSARGFSLWHFFPSLLFSSTCCLSFYALYCRPFFLICKEFFTNSKKYLYLFVLPAALFILFTASTWTWVIWIYLILFHDCS